MIRRILRGFLATARTVWWAMWHDSQLDREASARMLQRLEQYGVDALREQAARGIGTEQEEAQRWRWAEEQSRLTPFTVQTCRWILDSCEGDRAAALEAINVAITRRCSFAVACDCVMRRGPARGWGVS